MSDNPNHTVPGDAVVGGCFVGLFLGGLLGLGIGLLTLSFGQAVGLAIVASVACAALGAWGAS